MNEPVHYSWKLLRAGTIRLDGGGMFGVIPKSIWNRTVPCDEFNRITLSHNCLLLQSSDSRTHIVIEVGSGNKFDEKFRKIYGLSDYWIADALREAGCPPEQVNHVILTHLHFDHAGGLTHRDGITFPRAEIHVQKREWEDALANRSVMTRTYLRENLAAITGTQLVSVPPFAPGYVPAQREMPSIPLEERETEIFSGIFVFLVPGHTWGQQAVRFTDERGRVVVFTPDVLPTVAHAAPAASLGYDVEPYISSVTRHWFLREAVARNWLLVLDHEPGEPRRRVREDGRGWFELLPAE